MFVKKKKLRCNLSLNHHADILYFGFDQIESRSYDYSIKSMVRRWIRWIKDGVHLI